MKHFIIRLNLFFLITITLFMSSCGGTKKEAQEENGWTSLTEEQRDFWTKFDLQHCPYSSDIQIS
jgi:hypothetical protein